MILILVIKTKVKRYLWNYFKQKYKKKKKKEKKKKKKKKIKKIKKGYQLHFFFSNLMGVHKVSEVSLCNTTHYWTEVDSKIYFIPSKIGIHNNIVEILRWCNKNFRHS